MWPYQKDVVSNPGFKYILISGYGIMGLLLCLICGIWLIAPDRPSPDLPTNYVRGVRIMAFESPAMALRRDLIVVHADGEVTRKFVPSQGYDHPPSRRMLSQEQRQAIAALRAEWCSNLPRMSPQPSVTPYYDIRVECGIRRARHILLPADGLPPLLAMLRETVPQAQ